MMPRLSALSVIRKGALLVVMSFLAAGAARDAAGALTLSSLGLYNTGTDDGGTVLPPGSAAAGTDTHYSLISAPGGVATPNANATTAPGVWIANSAASSWITPQQFASPPNYAGEPVGWPDSAPSPGTYVYEATFMVEAWQAPFLEIVGRWATDNTGTLYLNGNLVSSSPTFSSWTNFILDSGFVVGENTLTFSVVNTTNLTTGNPTGLRAEFLAAQVPEPASLVGWGLILGAIAVGQVVSRRRNRNLAAR